MNMDKQMLTMIGVIVCLLACIYLYKENQKQRTEFLTFTQRMNTRLSQPSPAPPPPPKVKRQEVEVEDEPEEKSQ